MTRLPMLRVALLALVLAAGFGVTYTLNKVGVRTPLAEDQFVVHVELKDAAGLNAADHPLAAVAGTRQGRVVAVRRENGRAVATLELSPGVEGKLFRDATATVRPAGAVPVLSVDVTPGTPESGALADGATISDARTRTYVAPDRVLGMLDTDTRAQLQVLLGQADVALRDRGDDLAAATVQAAPLAGAARRVSRSIAERRVLVRQLVAELAIVARTLNERQDALVEAIDAGGRVLHTTAGQADALRATMAELPRLLADTRAALREVEALSTPLKAGLRDTIPALDELPAGLRQLRALTPQTSKLVDDLVGLEAIGGEQLPAVRSFTSRLAQAATAGKPSVTAAAKTVNTLSQYGGGLAQLGDLVSGAVSTSDANGVLARAILTAVEPVKPENLGFPAVTQKSASTAKLAQAAKLNAMLAVALEHRCRTEVMACVMRTTIPGLPKVETR